MKTLLSLVIGVALLAVLNCHADAKIEEQVAGSSKLLTWADLVNHPERWPAEVKLTVQLKFDGDTLNAGTVVRIDQVTAREVQLVAPQGFTFRVGPAECNLLQAANTFWAALTPDQKALTLQAIQRDPSLWPGRVKILEPLTFGSLRIDSGTVLTVKEVNGNEVNLIHPGARGNLVVSAQNTDLFARARELVATPLNERPGRMADLLKAATIDVDGKPVTLQPAHYYVIYFAGSTCPRCKIFTPQLVEHFNKTLANRKDVAFVTWPSDQATSQMLTYVRKNMIPWPTVPLEKIEVLSKEEEMISRNGVINLPGILVVDRFGSPLLATSKLNGQPLDAANAALAQLDTVLKNSSLKPGN